MFDPDHDPLELRVLHGPQAGARAALATGTPCLLATTADDTADIVLRDESAAPVRVRITTTGGHALVEVLDGRVTLGDRPLEAGAGLVWPMHAPMTIGASVVAFGQADQEVWADDETGDDDTPESAEPKLQQLKRGTPWLVTLGIGLTVVCAGLLAIVQVVSSPRAEVAPAITLAAALKASEFATLTTTQNPIGLMELHGRLATLAQRTALDSWLAAHQFTPLVNVQVDEAVARDVTDVFRVNGVAVKATVQGPGQIVAEAAEPDVDRLARAEGVVQRDVRGLDALKVVNRAQPAPPPSPPVPNDPGKRIASLVPGELAYLVTADGSRYFVGAMLPSGHRITQIEEQQVTLQRDGQTTTLNL